jgi:predicted glycoside hydrolase/deacetylase ChbG (UPF0249 family)
MHLEDIISESMQEARQLIINGDDYGLSPGINRGIEALYEQRRLTSTSVVTNSPWSAEAMAYASADKKLQVGVHLNLTSGRPLLPADRVSCLVKQDGTFYNTSAFLLRLLTGRLDLEQVEDEMRAQIQAVFDYGLKPEHIDTHMHFHAIPAMGHLIEQLAEQFDIKAVRNPDLFALVIPPFGKPSPVQNALRKPAAQLLQSTHRMMSNGLEGTSGRLSSADHVIYLRWCVEHKQGPSAGLNQCLATLSGETVEIVAHPALADEVLPQLSAYVKGRQQELEFLGGDEFATLLEEETIALVATE